MIDIKPFTMHVTPEQSKIVQEILFANGYCWGSGSSNIQYTHEENLIFECCIYTKPRFECYIYTKPRLRTTNEFDEDEPLITFEYFTLICMALKK